MKRNTLGFIVAVFSFTVGIAASALWIICRTPVEAPEEPTIGAVELEPDSCFPGLSIVASTARLSPKTYFPPRAFYEEPDPDSDIVKWYSKYWKR